MNTAGNHHTRPEQAFTLIEMITVITIMAIIATLVVSMGAHAAQVKKMKAVEAEKNRLISLIENYYAKFNYYPPDNGALISNTAFPLVYDAIAATNPLIYELIGATNESTPTRNGPPAGTMIVFNSKNVGLNSTIKTSVYAEVFNRQGIANADSAEPHNFFQPGPSPHEYGAYTNTPSGLPICGLLVPVELGDPKVPNFWHYDSSTTNRHHLDTYDLWAEFTIGNKAGRPVIITNGNW